LTMRADDSARRSVCGLLFCAAAGCVRPWRMSNLGMLFPTEVGVWLNLRRMDRCAFTLILQFDVTRTIARWSSDHEPRRRFDLSVLESGWHQPGEERRLDRSRGDLADSEKRPFQSLSARTSLYARSGSEMARKAPARSFAAIPVHGVIRRLEPRRIGSDCSYASRSPPWSAAHPAVPPFAPGRPASGQPFSA
jgi:hypothetical protein